MDTVLVNNDHPLLVLLDDLKSSLSKFQNEAHNSSLKLQHHSLSTSRALEKAHALEQENLTLKDELSTLRSNPLPSSSNSQDSINQLSLSLRALNEKLTNTESILLQRTTQLSHVLDDLHKSQSSTDAAYELCSRIQSREEQLESRERELELRVQLAEDRARMNERAVEEYADLVRSLQGQQPSSHSHQHHVVTPTQDETIQRLLREFGTEKENLHIQLSSAQHDLALVTSQNTALTKSSEITLSELVDLRMKLQLLERDDTTAAKMVSRYMKFSQTQTNLLQSTLSTLTERHSATLSSLTSHIHTLSQTIHHLQSHNSRLLSIIDDLGSEVVKEGYGRRREIRLRMRLVGREERILEGLKRWLRRSEERYSFNGGTGPVEVLSEMIQDAKILIDKLDNPLDTTLQHFDFDSDSSGETLSTTPLSGSLARLITIQSAINELVEDVQREHVRRVTAEGLVLHQEMGMSPPSALGGPDQGRKGILNGKIGSTRRESPTVIVLQPRHEEQSPSSHLNEESLPPPHESIADADSPNDTANPPVPGNHTPELPAADPCTLHHDSIGIEDVEPEFEDEPVPTVVTSVPVEEAHPADAEAEQEDEEIDQGRTATTSPADPEDQQHVGLDHDHENLDLVNSQSRDETGAVDCSDLSKPLAHPQPQSPTSTVLDLPSLRNPSPPSTAARDSPPSSDVPLPIPPLPHPLLKELEKARTRYDHIQRAFHACHIALESLKASLPLTTATNTASPNLYPYQRYPSPSTEHFQAGGIPNDVLNAIIQRLDDYTEDARVELEIRISDEEVLGRGYEALLVLPGAMRSASPTSFSSGEVGEGDEAVSITEVESQIRAFVDGTDPVISRALKLFERKLGDIEHDVAALKKAIHDPQSVNAPITSTVPHLVSSSPPTHTEPQNTHPQPTDSSTTTSSGWVSWIRTPSRPTTPTPSGPVPTFGNVITNRNRTQLLPIRRTVSAFGLSSADSSSTSTISPSVSSMATSPGIEVVKTLGLKVPMPDSTFALTTSRLMFTGGGVSPTTEEQISLGGDRLGAGAQRSRTISAMYMLGMGMNSTPAFRGRVISGAATQVGKPGTDGHGNGHVAREENDEDVD